LAFLRLTGFGGASGRECTGNFVPGKGAGRQFPGGHLRPTQKAAAQTSWPRRRFHFNKIFG